jgi:hypothetical protein
MSVTTIEPTRLQGRHRVKLVLPHDLSEWITSNKQLVAEVKQALRVTGETLSEDALWELIARGTSSEWSTAHTKLKTAETEWKQLFNPDRTSLGLIGMALDGDEYNEVTQRHDLALAEFTLINEGLRQRPDLRNLLDVLTVVQRKIQSSMALTEETLSATNDLNTAQLITLDEARPRLTSGTSAVAFNQAAVVDIAPQEKPQPLSSFFKSVANKLFAAKPCRTTQFQP